MRTSTERGSRSGGASLRSFFFVSKTRDDDWTKGNFSKVFRFERDDVATRRINGFPTTNDDASSSSSLCICLRAIRDLDRVLLCLDLSFRDRRPIIGPSEGENDSKQPRALAPVSLYKFFWFELLFGGRSCLKIYAVKQQASKHH